MSALQFQREQAEEFLKVKSHKYEYGGFYQSVFTVVYYVAVRPEHVA